MRPPYSKTLKQQKPVEIRAQAKACSMNTRQTQPFNKVMSTGLAALVVISFILILMGN